MTDPDKTPLPLELPTVDDARAEFAKDENACHLIDVLATRGLTCFGHWQGGPSVTVDLHADGEDKDPARSRAQIRMSPALARELAQVLVRLADIVDALAADGASDD